MSRIKFKGFNWIWVNKFNPEKPITQHFLTNVWIIYWTLKRDEHGMCFRGSTKAVINLWKKKGSLPLKMDLKKICRVQPLKALHNSLCNAACNFSSLFSRYRTHARLNTACSLAKVSSQMNFVLRLNFEFRGQHQSLCCAGLLRLHFLSYFFFFFLLKRLHRLLDILCSFICTLDVKFEVPQIPE